MSDTSKTFNSIPDSSSASTTLLATGEASTSKVALTIDDYKPEIRKAVRDCSDRGLYVASKWAAEFLLQYPITPRRVASSPFASTPLEFKNAPALRPIDSRINSPSKGKAPLTTPSHATLAAIPEFVSPEEEDLFIVARAHFDAREFERVYFMLQSCLSPKARFLGIYAKYLASEQSAMDDWASKTPEKPDNRTINAQLPGPVNLDLPEILTLLQNVSDPFLLFMKAIVLKGLGRTADAMYCIITSLNLYPWNWSCWTLLSKVIEDHDMLDMIRKKLPDHPVTRIFLVGYMVETHALTPELEVQLEDLVQLFPHSLYLRTLQALRAHSIRDYDATLRLFDEMLALDPYRTDEVDTLSNVLYTMKKQSELSQLAQRFMSVNRERPEVSLVIGNYYSLRNEHEKAIQYYKRAVQLDPTYGAAWTLMGHEFLEMKNSHAAIEAYRRGVDINKKDYRAWHGLGQAYELLDMPQYTLHYFQRSTALRPYDIRMWRALAKTYQNLDKPHEAIECQKRALIGADPGDTYSHLALAELYESLGEKADAAAHHRRCVDICIRANAPVNAYAKSALHVAKYEMNKAGDRRLDGDTGVFQGETGNLMLAREYLEKVAGSNSAEVAEADELLRNLNYYEAPL